MSTKEQWEKARLKRWTGTDLIRFWEKIIKTDNCWNWIGALNVDGYGLAWFNKKLQCAHRISFVIHGNSLKSGFVLDHLCRNRACVNPSHLELVSQAVNNIRGESITARKAQQTHCIHGHEFTLSNTVIRKNGSRRCRACDAESKRKQRLKLREGQ